MTEFALPCTELFSLPSASDIFQAWWERAQALDQLSHLLAGLP